MAILMLIIAVEMKTWKKHISLILPIILLITFYSFYMQGGSRRYFTPLTPLLVILFSYAVITLIKKINKKISKEENKRKIKLIAIISIILLWNANGAISWQTHNHHLIKETLDAAKWLNENTPENATIGSFDAGVIAYYTKRRVINLDGKVNPYALKAREEGKLWEYIQEAKINYIANQGYKNNTNLTWRLKNYKEHAILVKELDSTRFPERIYILKTKDSNQTFQQ